MLGSDRSADADSVTLVFDSRQDDDGVRENIAIAIDADSLPQNYDIGASHTWTIGISDNKARSLSFLHGSAARARGKPCRSTVDRRRP